MKFSDHLWLPFVDQPQSDVLAFAIFYLYIFIIIVTYWKHGTVPNDIVIFNTESNNHSITNKEEANIDESSYEESVVVLL